MPRPPWHPVHGIVLLDKPLGMSSNQALQAVRRLFGAAKGGHTGALDPLATGLLPLCFGEATKLAGELLGSRKAYQAEVALGATTNTGDLEGEVLSRRPVPELEAAQLEAALAPLRGTIEQVPPAYSALKQGGEPAYRKARRGEEVALAPRSVTVHALELIQARADRLRLHVECGSGTYIRSLAVDLGEALGCGAHLAGLRRLWVEPFTAPVMWALDDLRDAADRGGEVLARALLPVSDGVSHWPRQVLDTAQATALGQGQAIWLGADVPSGRCAVYGPGDRLLALGEIAAGGKLRVTRGFNLPSGPA